MRQEFEIPGKLPSLNEWTRACKSHYANAGKLKREVEEKIGWCIKQGRIKPVKGRINVYFTWIEPNMKRDKDNIAFAKKFILDALQTMGIISNDGWKVINGFEDTFRLNRTHPRIIVEIEEVDQ